MNLKDYLSNDELLNLTKNLIVIQSHKMYEKREEELALWIKNVLQRENISVQLDYVEDIRPNIYASLKGTNCDDYALMLTGHIDTIPGFEMEFDPFEPVVKDGILYGRGSADMKGGIAAMLGALIAVKRSGALLKKGVIFAGVIDEEECSLGTEHMIRTGIRADAAVIGEPTDLRVAVMHKGMEWVEVTFIGIATHGSRPHEGINAVNMAAEFIVNIRDILQPQLEDRTFSLLGCGTVNVGVINGGHDPNIVPDRCIVKIDRRWLPNETIESVHNEIRELAEAVVARTGGSFQIRGMREATASMLNTPFNIDPDKAIVQHSLKSTEEVLGCSLPPISFPAWSDAALLQNNAGMDCIVLGPGNIDMAHSAVECCNVEEIQKAAEIYFKLIEKLCFEEVTL